MHQYMRAHFNEEILHSSAQSSTKGSSNVVHCEVQYVWADCWIFHGGEGKGTSRTDGAPADGGLEEDRLYRL